MLVVGWMAYDSVSETPNFSRAPIALNTNSLIEWSGQVTDNLFLHQFGGGFGQTGAERLPQQALKRLAIGAQLFVAHLDAEQTDWRLTVGS